MRLHRFGFAISVIQIIIESKIKFNNNLGNYHKRSFIKLIDIDNA